MNQNLDFYKGRKVRLILKNKWRYKGEVVDISEQFLILDEIKVGRVSISLSDISMMALWESGVR